MTALVFADEISADRFMRACSFLLGYPKDGVNVGGGRHVDAATGRTYRHAQWFKHPTLPSWAHPTDPVIDGLNSRSTTIDGQLITVNTALAVTLDGTWFP